MSLFVRNFKVPDALAQTWLELLSSHGLEVTKSKRRRPEGEVAFLVKNGSAKIEMLGFMASRARPLSPTQSLSSGYYIVIFSKS